MLHFGLYLYREAFILKLFKQLNEIYKCINCPFTYNGILV